jgi:D-3-phosphoglycerate dehydrogenase
VTFVVVVADNIDEQGIDLLRKEPDFEVVSTVGAAERLPRELSRAQALLVRSSTRVTEELLAHAPLLRVVGRAGIGVDNIDVQAATRHGIAVINAPGANTVSAAEHAFALLLALVRRVPWASASMRRGEWDRKSFGGTELRGKVLGLVGLGRIGAHVSGIARAFGMDVIAYDPVLSGEGAKQLHVHLVELDNLLERADVISLHAPITDETRHLLNKQRLALMKPTAVVINTARGGLIDTEALCDAVESGKLAGAALDVFDPEPLACDSPLRNCGNIILTPHLAASTQEAQARVSVEISRSVRDALRTGDVGRAINVPGVSSEELARSRGALDLARRIGGVAAVLARGPVQAVEVDYGGRDDGAPKPVMLAALEGVLRSSGIHAVSLINAAMIAEEREISVHRRIGKPVAGHETTVGVKVETPDRTATVVGALAGDQQSVIRIDDYTVDIPSIGDMLIIKNRDVPGVIGQVGTVLGGGDVNIGFYYQARNERAGGDALAAVGVDQLPSAALLSKLKALPDVLEVWLVSLDNGGGG